MPPTGRVIAGRYNLQQPIGRGAMGVVWRARDLLLDREVAVKEVVISALIGSEERRNAYQRTLREARTAARLSHRGVVTVYDVAEEDGRPWIVMELIPSQSLDQVLTVQGRLPAARACDIGQQLLSALAAAHTAGVLHRDVKPSNVLIAHTKVGDGWEERAVLTDFGIAQFEGDSRLTQTGMVMGSPGFTAPERIRGGDATPASDLWSLGATIYAAVEGRGPYEQRGGAITTMSAIINEDAPVAPHAGQLAPLIAALLRRDPAARPSAGAAVRMFAQVLPQLTGAPEQPPAAPHAPTMLSTYKPPSAAPDAPAPAPATPAPATPAPATPAPATPAPAPAPGPAPVAPAAPAPVTTHKDDAPAHAAPAPAAAERVVAGVPEPPRAASASAASAPAGPDSAGDLKSAAAEPAAKPAPEAEPAPDAGSEPAGVEPPTFPAPVIAKVAAAEAPAVPAATEPPRGDAPVVLEGHAAAEAPSARGEADVADKASGHKPTERAIPVARVAPSEPAQRPAEERPVEPRPAERPAEQRPREQRPAEQPPAPLKPTFTAVKPAERPTPSYSAASPAGPPPAPAAQDRRPVYSPAAGPGSPGGGTPQFATPGGNYAGPSQAQPDLARQYTPGSGGGRTTRGRGRGRLIAFLAAIVIAAAVGVGVALALSRHNGGSGSTGGSQSTGTGFVTDTTTAFKSVNALNNPTAVLPSGWWNANVTPAQLGAPAVAGFSLDLPPGWAEKRSGQATEFTGPGDMLVEVDLTPQKTPDMLAAATSIENESVAEGKFPGYKRLNLQEVPVRNTKGAFWKFTWTPSGSAGLTADDILFAKAVPAAGTQDYAIYIRSTQNSFDGTALPLFDQILQTFETVPAS